MTRWVWGLLGVLWMPVAWAAPDVTMSITPSATAGATITATDENTRNAEIGSKYNSHTHTDISQTASTLNIGVASGGTTLASTGALTLEGATADGFEVTVQATDPTADATLNLNLNNLTTARTVVVPNANSVFLPTGAAFFMLTGSCPSGTTDITATYADKFIRIHATQGTTAGADTHTHAAGSYAGPSHTHTGSTSEDNVRPSAGTSNKDIATGAANNAPHNHPFTTDAGGTGTVTGTSASGSNVPAYVTMKLCQVD